MCPPISGTDAAQASKSSTLQQGITPCASLTRIYDVATHCVLTLKSFCRGLDRIARGTHPLPRVQGMLSNKEASLRIS
eukprot:3201808-Amphidinium_carterae.1